MVSVHIKRLLVDALKSRETSIIELSRALCGVDGVEEVDITVTEVDVTTETIKVTIKGSSVNYGKLAKMMEKYGISVKGIDEVSVAKVKGSP
jgi:hypothetical protein